MPRSITDIQRQQHDSGLFTNMKRAAYDRIAHLNPSSIAKGLVDHEEIDPTAIKDEFEKPSNNQRTAAQQDNLDMGTLGHMMLLEPERVHESVAVWDGKVRSGDVWEKFQVANIGKLIVRRCDFTTMSAAVRAYRFQRQICQLVSDVDVEVAVFSKEHSFYTKGLMDAVTRGDCCNILDPKFTDAGLSLRQTDNTLRDFRNREKMAAYRRWVERETGREVIGCYNLFFSMSPPYRVRIKKMSSDALSWGESRIEAAMQSVQDHLETGKWPMFIKEDIVTVGDWEKEEIDNLIEGSDDE